MKNLLFELDQSVTLPVDATWTPHSPNVYKITYSWGGGSVNSVAYGLGYWGQGPYGQAGTVQRPGSQTSRIVRAGSLIVDENPYTLVSSINDLSSADATFYFDRSEQVLYVRFLDDKYPSEFGFIVLGVTKGYAQRAGFYDGIYYDARVLNGPNLRYEKDPLFFGKISIDTFNVTLENADHHFDLLNELYPFGNAIRIYFGEDGDDFSNFEVVFTGFFESFALNGTFCVITGADERKRLSVRVPSTRITQTDFADLPDGEWVKPLVYGTVRKSRTVPLNEENDSATNYQYMFIDLEHYSTVGSVSDVYVDNVKLDSANWTVYQANDPMTAEPLYKYIQIANTYVEPGQEVTVDLTGYDIVHPLEIIEDLIYKFAGLEYNPFYYNTTEWEAAKLEVVDEIQFSITEEISLFEAIEQITNTVFGLFLVGPDGRFTFKLRDTSKAVTRTFYPYELLDPPRVEFNQNEFVSSLRIGYDKAYGTDRWSWYTTDSEEDRLSSLYNRKNTQDILTLLKDSTDAEAAAEEIYPQFAGIFPTFTLEVQVNEIDIELEDIIDAYVYKLNDGSLASVRLEVIGIEYDFNTLRQIIRGRWVQYNFEIEDAVEIVRSVQYGRPYSNPTEDDWDLIIYADNPEIIISP